MESRSRDSRPQAEKQVNGPNVKMVGAMALVVACLCISVAGVPAAFTEAGVPKGAFSIYPGGAEAGAALLAAADRAMIFGENVPRASAVVAHRLPMARILSSMSSITSSSSADSHQLRKS